VSAARGPAARTRSDERSAGLLRQLASRCLSPLADASVLLSFDRGGFALHSAGFRERDLDVDLTGRRALVTGANSGIGRATALGLAARGAETWLLCRDAGRGEAAAAEIRGATRNPDVRCEGVDVADLRSLRAFAERFEGGHVDVLVHNAGVLPASRSETRDGLERCFATHVAGPFLLTWLLEEKLKAAPSSRVVWVSSGGMYTRRLQVEDAQWRARPYDGVRAYAETKRAQLVLSELWAQRWRTTRLVSNAMHPGWADTPAVRSSLPGFHRWMRSRLRSPEQGADTVLWLACARAAARRSGEFFFDRRTRRSHWLPWTRESDAEREALWRICLESCSLEEWECSAA
jgi:NAD(P)-dependent dehydrogenase (short-subunit alcohol dehydrogenase family)